MEIGYARVSKYEQHLDLQLAALKDAGCKEIYTDKISTRKETRPALVQALSHLRPGDTFIVWRLDRLGRSLRELIDIVNTLQERGVEFKSLTEAIDTTTSSGKLTFHIFASLAEFERELIRERTNAGLAAARARGKSGGRPKVLTQKQIAMLNQLAKDPNNTVTDICKTLGIGRTTYYRYLKAE
jgi:DNA invertase Pin-like site-specific DNA recombinase